MEPQSTTTHDGSNPYQYTPVDENKQEIRLLTLLPGQFSAEIRVCLDIARFTKDQIPTFEAISYTWGSAENPVSIFIGKSSNKTLLVTQNLAEALPYFRFEDKPRVLWIDAICVDQQNLGERGHQVKRMADIYSRAAKVLIWVGPEAQNSSRALKCVDLIASKVKWDYNTQLLLAITEDVHWADPNTELSLVHEEWIALSHLIDRPWFERLWIRQEVTLASEAATLMCGHQTIPWTSVCHAVACLWVKHKGRADRAFIEHFQTRLRIIVDLCYTKRGMVRDLIASTKHCVCSDPRDKIYALLSLMSAQMACKIEPDYTKSVHEVYRDTVLSTIRTTQFYNLDILTTVDADEHGQRFSSWIPDLSSPRRADPLTLNLASSNTMHTIPLETNRLGLTVEGLLIGVVEKVHLMMPSFELYSTISDIQNLKRIATFALSLEYPLQQQEIHEHQLNAFCRTIIINDVRERFSPEVDALPSVTQIQELMKALLRSPPEFESTIVRMWPAFLRMLLPLAESYCKGRSFFVSREGKFGLGPYNTKPGDLVAILLGCRTPMVLRACSDDGYKVIGEAYYDGFTDGEALLGSIPQPYVVRYRFDGTQFWYWNYLNEETGLFQAEDPRLGPLSPGYSVRSHPGEDFFQWIVNDSDETGKRVYPDPRLTSEALRKRGVPLQEILLI